MMIKEMAAHLCMSPQNFRKVCKSLGVSPDENTIDEIREVYIRDLRGKASGASNELMRIRTLKEEQEVRRLVRLNETEEKNLIQVDELLPQLEAAVAAMMVEFLDMGDKIKPQYEALYGSDFDPSIISDECRAICQRTADTITGAANAVSGNVQRVATTGTVG